MSNNIKASLAFQGLDAEAFGEFIPDLCSQAGLT
jgi:hypothetical protein